MTRYTGLILSLALLAPVSIWSNNSHPQASTTARRLYVEGEILVKIKQEAAAYVEAGRVGEEVLAGKRARAEAVVGGGSGQQHSGGLYLIRYEGAESVEEAVRQAEADPRVEYAEPNYLLFTQETRPNDQFFNQQWGLHNDGAETASKPGADIGALRAWDLTQGSNDVVVAVIDTGVDLSHPDLAANAWVNPREVADNGVDEDGNGLVDDVNGWNYVSNNNRVFQDARADFHGTHVAGIIGAVGDNGAGVAGVAWRVKLMSLKFIGERTGQISDAVKAINYVIEQKRRGINVRVINASWGGPASSSSLRSAILAAGDAGILFVCAAGNGGGDFVGDDIDDQPEYPSSWSAELGSLLSVAALDKMDQLASFSNYGLKSVCVGAPGVGILSTVPGGGYGFAGGTSMATPHVAGIAALIWSRESTISAAQVRERIISTAEPVLALASKAVNPARASAYNAASKVVPNRAVLAINAVKTSKKALIVDGLGFLRASTVIELNGAALSGVKYDSAYELGNGTLTRLTRKVKKPQMNVLFPLNVGVTITVYNPATGERSTPFIYTRTQD